MPHITFIHGILNKPPLEVLLKSWVGTIAQDGGIDLDKLGVTYSMVYWADVLYAKPEDEDAEVKKMAATGSPGLKMRSSLEDAASWRRELKGDDKEFTDKLAAKFRLDDDSALLQSSAGVNAEQKGYAAIPLPNFLKNQLMERFLHNVYCYLFNTEATPRPGETYRVQDETRNRFVGALKTDAAGNASSPHLVVSHSMGTVIAYDCLECVAGCPAVNGLMTIGSPLGLDEVQERLTPEWTRENGYPSQKLRVGWSNVYDSADIVCAFDPRLANDFMESGQNAIRDVYQENDGWWRHDISKYLGGRHLRDALKDQLRRNACSSSSVG